MSSRTIDGGTGTPQAARDSTTGRPAEQRSSLTLLSGFELRCDGRRVAVSMPGQRLLAFLALQTQPVLRSYASGTLWLESNEENAAGSLRSALWRLRQPGYRLVEATSRHVWLSPLISVDVSTAVAWAQRILSGVELDDGDVERATTFGDLLPDWYDDWLVIERERVRQLTLHALEELCDRLRQERRFGQALEVALAAVRRDPLRETAHRAVIQVHLAEGNVAEAVRHYRFYVRLLREQLDLSPSRRLDELMRSFDARVTFR